MSAPAWRVPVRLEEVPAAGQRFALEADAATRAGLSAAAGLAGMPRLTATFDVVSAVLARADHGDQTSRIAPSPSSAARPARWGRRRLREFMT